MIRAIFFDLDDTLYNGTLAWKKAEEETFSVLLTRRPDIREQEFRVAWEAVNQSLFRDLFAGNTSMAEVRDKRFRQTLADMGIPNDHLADELNDFLGNTFLSHLELFHDVSVMDSLRLHFHVGIITNGAGDAHPDSQYSKAVSLCLLDKVDSFWVSDNVGYRKPDPRIFHEALNAIAVEPQAAVFVGDSIPNDMAGANLSGMVSILVCRSAHAQIPISMEQRPDYTVSSLFEIPEIVDRIKEAKKRP